MIGTMGAYEYDDTEMTHEEFDEAVQTGAPADVSNVGGRVATVDWDVPRQVSTAASAVTRSETARLAGNQTIMTTMVLAGK